MKRLFPILTLLTLSVVIPARAGNRQEKANEDKMLAAELKGIHTVCVVPPERADGGLDYSDAGELAKVFRDYLIWEASVCDVEYHAGGAFIVHDREKCDAYVELSRHENTAFSSATGSPALWQLC